MGKENTFSVTSDDVHRCLQHGTSLNITASRVMVSYTDPGNRTLVWQDGGSNVCWLQVNGPSSGTELVVEWLAQTCDLVSYVSIHSYSFSAYQRNSAWKSITWTGCEPREDPISPYYQTAVNRVHVGLHVRDQYTPYNVSLAIQATPKLRRSSPITAQEYLEITFVSPFSGTMCVCM